MSATRRIMIVCFFVGLLLRFLAAGFQDLSHDAACFYLPNARALLEGGLGNWDGMTIAVPPLFPTMVAGIAAVLPGEDCGALEQAALLLSMLAGACMIFPVLGLARRFFPEREPVHHLAVIVTALQPLLVRYGGDARADSMYALLFVSAFWSATALATRPRIKDALLFGLFVGAAYLLRPEALGLPIVLAGAVIVGFVHRRRSGGDAGDYFRKASVAGVVAFAVLVPSLAWNACFVHHKIGLWTLSPKAGILLDFDKPEKGDVFGMLNESKTKVMHEEMLTSPQSYKSFSLAEAVMENPGAMARALARNLGDFAKFLPDVMGVFPFLLFAFGIFWSRGKVTRSAPWMVMATIAFFALSISIFYMTRRFWLPFLPLLMPWCGAGGLALASWLFKERPRSFTRVVVLTMVATLPQSVYSAGAFGEGWWRSSERILGDRLRERFGAEQQFVSAKGKTAWHAHGSNLLLPTSNPLADIAEYMQNREARFLVLDHARSRSWIVEIATALKSDDRFVEVERETSDEKDLRVFELNGS